VLGWQPFSTVMVDGWFLGIPSILEVTDHSEVSDYLETWHARGVGGTVSHVRVLTCRSMEDLLNRIGFEDIEVHTRGYLLLRGRIADFMCRIDRRHELFLVATGFKPVPE